MDPSEAFRLTFLLEKWRSKKRINQRPSQALFPSLQNDRLKSPSTRGVEKPRFSPGRWPSKSPSIHQRRYQADFPSQESDAPKTRSTWGVVTPTFFPAKWLFCEAVDMWLSQVRPTFLRQGSDGSSIQPLLYCLLIENITHIKMGQTQWRGCVKLY